MITIRHFKKRPSLSQFYLLSKYHLFFNRYKNVYMAEDVCFNNSRIDKILEYDDETVVKEGEYWNGKGWIWRSWILYGFSELFISKYSEASNGYVLAAPDINTAREFLHSIKINHPFQRNEYNPFLTLEENINEQN